MTLSDQDIVPGAIAYFDALALTALPSVKVSGDPVDRPGLENPFVCYEVRGERCAWAPLTGTFKTDRLRIEANWVSSDFGPLGGGEVFLQDGETTYTGPKSAFQSAASSEPPFREERPRVSSEGLEMIHKEIAERGGIVKLT
jgi:hypothetical protein